MAQHQDTINAAQQREKAAQGEVDRIEKEMQELTDNRDGKISALKVRKKENSVLKLNLNNSRRNNWRNSSLTR